MTKLPDTTSSSSDEFRPLLKPTIDSGSDEMSSEDLDHDQSPSVLTEDDQTNLSPGNAQSRPNPFMKYGLILIKIFFPSLTFLKFFIAAIIPAIADQLIPLFYTGQIPDQSALALAGQFTFISIVLEVIQEGVGNSLFHYIGKNYKDHRILALQGFKISLIILSILGSVLTIAILSLTSQFVSFMNTPAAIVESTKRFLWFSSFSFPITLVNQAMVNYFYISTSSLIIASQLTQVLLSFLLNFFLFGQQSASLHWGVAELGHYKIIQACASLICNSIFFLIIEKMSPKAFLWDTPLIKDLRTNLTSLFRISWGNFGDSAVRNLFYFLVTLKFINYLGEAEIGAWNLLNTIVWGVLLIPSYTVANYVKVRIGHVGELPVTEKSKLRSAIKKVAQESVPCLIAWLLVVSIISCFGWPWLASVFSESNTQVQDLSATFFYQLGWIFLIFSANNAMDSLFFGTGETSYIFYQSLVTNLVVYLIPWILYETKILVPTYYWVYGLYIAGMLVDFGLTTFFCFHLWSKIPNSVSATTA